MRFRRILPGLSVLFAWLVFCGPVTASGGWPFSFGKPDFELTGTVFDKTTNQPIEGAYVVALYFEQYAGMGAIGSRCVKTKGMYTGKDGKFHFPVEKLDGSSPGEVNAIKRGYRSDFPIRPPPDVWKKQGKEAYTGRDLPLVPQIPEKPEWWFGSGNEYCDQAKTRGDAAAGVEFLKIQLSEYVRLDAGEQGIRAVGRMIQRLESLSENAAVPRNYVDTIK